VTPPPHAPGDDHVDLLFAGAVFCDIVFSGVPVPAPGTEVFADAFTVTPGGTANRAVAAARLGATTSLVSELGDDPLGAYIAGVLANEANLDLTYLRRTAGWQSPVTTSLTGAHDRSFITYQEPGHDLDWPDNGPTVGATHVNAAADLPAWVARVRADGTTVVGGVGWDSTGRWSPDLLRRLENVDIFVPNDVEAMKYTQTDDPIAAARELGGYVELAIVTRGPQGVVAFDSGSGTLIETPAIAVDAVDPTGAGDVFVAAFMASLRTDWPLETRLRFGSLCASLSVRTLGGAASAPRPPDISRYLTERQPQGDWSLIEAWATARDSSRIKEEV
jgi:sugar/nucleoside kinase (ribokinase family)